MTIDRKTSALIVVDVQNDFCPGGALAVKGGDAVVEPCNRAMRFFDHIVLTQDWHPLGHVSFASTWPGKRLYSQIEVAGEAQTLWPDHCVAGSAGADFHPRLDAPKASLVLRKGRSTSLDSYSAFLENDRRTSTGLAGYLRELGVQDLYLAGLATDYCVLASGLDAISSGFRLCLIADAVRGVDLPAGSAIAAIEKLKTLGAAIIAVEDLGALP
ncbi:MAG TPA: bifunctional nicotinamidase/pyrazinamidase [Rectinemataceae bacterium]|nr:bifunctional nicotinamidase/pyrazinamidase [Rectinemataceae bacterium]